LKIDVVESEQEGKRDEEFSGLDAVFHTEACAFDKDDFVGLVPEWLQVRVTEPQRAAGRLEVSRSTPVPSG